MIKRPRLSWRTMRRHISLIVLTLAFTLPAVAQTRNGPSTSATVRLQNKAERWTGLYDGPAKVAPSGFTILLPRDQINKIVLTHLQPWTLARVEATDFEIEDMGQLCKPVGIFRSGAGEGGFELLVSPGSIALISDGGGGIDTGGVRRIYLNRPHLKSNPLLWFGDSVGHWEGDTLVVDTVGFNDQTWLSEGRTRHSEAMHVAERWRLVANGTYLEHITTVEDPLAFTSPYTLSRYYKKLDPEMPMHENLCEDIPEGRRGWVKLHNRAVREREEYEKVVSQSEAKKSEEQ